VTTIKLYGAILNQADYLQLFGFNL